MFSPDSVQRPIYILSRVKSKVLELQCRTSKLQLTYRRHSRSAGGSYIDQLVSQRPAAPVIPDFLSPGMSSAAASPEPATGLPVCQGLQIGEFCTLAGLPAYVVPPRDPATYGGRALLVLPDVTGTANVHNLILAGVCSLSVLHLASCGITAWHCAPA